VAKGVPARWGYREKNSVPYSYPKVNNVTGDADFLSAAAMKPYYCGVNPEE